MQVNELSGIIEEVSKNVTKFKKGDKIYSRLPIDKIGAFAEYVAVNADAISHMPKNLDFKEAVAVPLTGLTAYQGLHEELEAKAGQIVFIPGGSGSFGQMAIPIAKSMGLSVIVSGNARAREQMMKLGVDSYLDYTKEYDKLARKEEKEYRFIFVRADGEQLKEITRIVEENNIVPSIDSRIFTIEEAGEALKLVANGHTNGKVIGRVDRFV